jgi:hypothetical protein
VLAHRREGVGRFVVEDATAWRRRSWRGPDFALWASSGEPGIRAGEAGALPWVSFRMRWLGNLVHDPHGGRVFRLPCGVFATARAPAQAPTGSCGIPRGYQDVEKAVFRNSTGPTCRLDLGDLPCRYHEFGQETSKRRSPSSYRWPKLVFEPLEFHADSPRASDRIPPVSPHPVS